MTINHPKASFAMSWKTLLIATTLLSLGVGTPIALAAEPSECVAGEKIDGSTVDTARTKIEKAGFQKIEGLKKGCDNFWHGQALQNGLPVNVVLSPQGQVMTEGN